MATGNQSEYPEYLCHNTVGMVQILIIYPEYTSDYGNGAVIIFENGLVLHVSHTVRHVLNELAQARGKSINFLRRQFGRTSYLAPMTLDPMHTFIPLKVRHSIGRDGAYAFFKVRLRKTDLIHSTPSGYAEIILPDEGDHWPILASYKKVMTSLQEGEQQHDHYMLQVLRAMEHPSNHISCEAMNLYMNASRNRSLYQ